MPREAKGPRLWFDDTLGYWYIRDGKSKRGTGCRRSEREGAEKALAAYIAEKYEPPSDNRPDRLLVADILTYYAREIAPGQKSAETTSYDIDRLREWWGARKLSDVKRSTCSDYVKHRMGQPIRQAKTKEAKRRKVSKETTRRELTTLRSAINAYHEETPLTALPIVTLPDAAPPRERFLTREEAARLLWATRRLKDRHAGEALRRFILLGLYTGSRSGVIRKLAWMPNTLGGWIDLEAGIIKRRGDAQTETKKRRPPIRIPDRMLGFLRRWKAADDLAAEKAKEKRGDDAQTTAFVVHYRDGPIASQRRSWALARDAAGLGKDVTPHVLRHTAVTWMMQTGADIWDVAQYVGMSVKMLDDVYGHHHPAYQKEMAAKIGRKRVSV